MGCLGGSFPPAPPHWIEPCQHSHQAENQAQTSEVAFWNATLEPHLVQRKLKDIMNLQSLLTPARLGKPNKPAYFQLISDLEARPFSVSLCHIGSWLTGPSGSRTKTFVQPKQSSKKMLPRLSRVLSCSYVSLIFEGPNKPQALHSVTLPVSFFHCASYFKSFKLYLIVLTITCSTVYNVLCVMFCCGVFSFSWSCHALLYKVSCVLGSGCTGIIIAACCHVYISSQDGQHQRS